MKVRTSILIEREILKQAKEIGLNISKICENAVKIYITRLQAVNEEIASGSGAGRSSSVVGHRPDAAKVAGSSPARPTIKFSIFLAWFFRRGCYRLYSESSPYFFCQNFCVSNAVIVC